jgi:outer membrane protein insertion porin family
MVYHFTKYLDGSLSYYIEKVNQDSQGVASDDITGEERPNLYNKSGVILNLTRDSSDPLFFPIKGMFISVTMKFNTDAIIRSDFHYTKFLLDARRYDKLLKTVLAYRVKIGALDSFDDDGFIPTEDRFFSGGSMSVRGWSRSELGPKDSEDTPIGGKSLLEVSMELRHPIWNLFSGVVFMDAGNVWENEYKYELNELRYSLGIGIRVATPIGPVRFDIAWPIDDIEKSTKFHINVGQAF